MSKESALERYVEPIAVLDHGMVRLVDLMGDDSRIVQAARASYGKGTTTFRSDRNLIRYLMCHEHLGPFEMPKITLHVKVPIDTWRQWVRHRTAAINEYSTRYSEALDEMYRVGLTWRLQDKHNHQGSRGTVMDETFKAEEAEIQERAREVYNNKVRQGVARELARKDLPMSTYTMAYWTIDLRNLLHFLKLRLDTHAQYEIRMYAEAIAEIVKEWVPVVWEAFEDYVLEAVYFSRWELVALGTLPTPTKNANLTDREWADLVKKVEKHNARIHQRTV